MKTENKRLSIINQSTTKARQHGNATRHDTTPRAKSVTLSEVSALPANDVNELKMKN